MKKKLRDAFWRLYFNLAAIHKIKYILYFNIFYVVYDVIIAVRFSETVFTPKPENNMSNCPREYRRGS